MNRGRCSRERSPSEPKQTVPLSYLGIQVIDPGAEGLGSGFFLGRCSCFRRARCLPTASRDASQDWSEGHVPQLALPLLSPPRLMEPLPLRQRLPVYEIAHTMQRIKISNNKDDDNRERGQLRLRIGELPFVSQPALARLSHHVQLSLQCLPVV